MRRRIPLIAGIVAAIGLTACGGSNGTDEPDSTPKADASENADLSGSLEIWADQTKAPAVKTLTDKMMQDYPGVKVNIVQKNFEDIGPDFITQVPTGKGPDVIITPHDQIGGMLRAGVIAPVELGELADQLDPVTVEAFTLDGQTYGVPYAIENIGLVRNNALTQDTPETWDDMVASGKKVKGAKFPVAFNVTEEGDPFHMYPMETSFGSEIFQRNDDGTYAPELTLNNDAGLEFAEWLSTQGKNGTGVLDTSMTADIATEAFLNGKVPYLITGPWTAGDIRKAKMDVDVLPIPAAGDETAKPFVGVQGFVISAESENQLLANEFLVNYVGTVDGQMEMFRQDPRTPALTEAAESPEVVDDPINVGFAEAGTEGVPMPSIPEMAHTWVLWGRAEAAIINGKDPKATWQTMADNIQKTIDQN